LKQAHIVLIEDNPGDVLLVELALEEAGITHKLTRFETAAEAAERLCEPKGEEAINPDIILMDLNTPQSDGFAVLARLTTSANLSAVPIALLTSSKARADKDRARLQGARYIEKPSQLQDFLSQVGRAVSEMLMARGLLTG
jgi:CheY-like chemotaxis protein